MDPIHIQERGGWGSIACKCPPHTTPFRMFFSQSVVGTTMVQEQIDDTLHRSKI